jgi:hypothetical protein
MSLDFQQVQEQVRQLGEQAKQRQKVLQNVQDLAFKLLDQYSLAGEELRAKVERASRHDPSLRCACPPDPAVHPIEPLIAAMPPSTLPASATILAADGSQIPVDRHAEVLYCLINVGAIQMHLGKSDSPQLTVHCRLMYDESLFTPYGLMTEATLALLRDKEERTILAELARQAEAPVITFTDGPIELWGAKEGEGGNFEKQLDEYLASLRELHRMNVTTAGYVEKPFANLVVRLLEVANAKPEEMKDLKNYHPLRGFNDLSLFNHLLDPGERSAIFAMQSQSAQRYRDELALHFFYLNVGRPNHPWLARVEIPAWVAEDSEKLNNLHAVLVDQCRWMGNRRYPYLLLRAHETAMVSFNERDQVTQMIALELRKQGVEVGELSHKQGLKDSL